MQNIKKFRITSPTKSQLLKYKSETGEIPQFLTSEDGQDWYECQKLFADDTIKILYDENNVIRSVIDKPVPQRGNIYAVSMFFPLNMSVAEIAAANYPSGVALNGTWKFDGRKVYQDTTLVDNNVLTQNRDIYEGLLTKAMWAIAAIQCSAAVNNPRTGDPENLLTLQQYVDQLRDVDLTLASPAWPELPSYLS